MLYYRFICATVHYLSLTTATNNNTEIPWKQGLPWFCSQLYL
jgi:hypothetical protein